MNDKKSWARTFFAVWGGQSISLLTSSIVQFAIVWYITQKTDSPAMLSLASLMAFLPQGILGPFAGVLIDRYDRKRVMILSDLCIAAAGFFLAVWGMFGEHPMWAVMSVLAVRSIGSAFHTPAAQALTPSIAPEEMLTKCAGYSQSFQSASLIVSPALASILFAVWKLPFIILLDVGGALIAVFILMGIRLPEYHPGKETEMPNVLREIKEGFLVLKKQRALFALTAISCIFGLLYAPINALFPLMSMSYFQGTAFHAGLSESLFSIGLLLGSLLLGIWGGFRNRLYMLILSFGIMGLALTGTGLLPPGGFVWFAVFAVFMGASAPYFTGTYMALLQERIAPDYLGRVFSLSGSLMMLSTPLGLLASGLFAEWLGIERWFGLSGILILFLAAVCVLTPSIRRIDKEGKR